MFLVQKSGAIQNPADIDALTSSPRFKPGDSSYRFAVGEVLVSKRLPRIRV